MLPEESRLPERRIADADRDRAILLLRHHCTEGRITLDEFSDRVGLVYDATTSTALEHVLSDLPAVEQAEAPPAIAASSTVRRRNPVTWTVSMFSANQRKGRWRIENETVAVSFMGGCLLDLRQAEVVGDEATITAIAFMGGVDIVVPEGIEVVLEGFAFMGGKHAAIKDVPVLPGSPLIRVRAFAFMGGVNVRSKPAPGERGTKDERRAAVRAARDAHRHRTRHPDREMRHPERRGLDRADGGSPPPLPRMPGPPLLRGIDAVADDVRDEWPRLRSQVAPEGTVTIFFSDIEGYTSMTERLGDYMAQELLQQHYAIVREQLLKHRGFEVKVHGDGFMLAFDSASRALRCAIAIQQAQTAWNETHSEQPIRIRMGLHTGEAIRSDDDDFLGSTVNLASRIATAARGGEILVSSLLKELCAATGEFGFDGGQEIELKGLSRPHRVFAVDWE